MTTTVSNLTHDEAILSWDESKIVDEEVKNIKSSDPDAEEDSLRDSIFMDSDLWLIRRADMNDRLTELMEEKNPEGRWNARVSNFGWRKMSGTTGEFTCDNGEALLQKILPKADCTFYIHEYEENGKEGFAIQNYHHDSPTGDEWYYILPA